MVVIIMAGIWLNKEVLINELFEITGYKTGLCLTYKDMAKFLADTYYLDLLEANLNGVIRIRPEEYEEMYFSILRGTGHIPLEYPTPGPFVCAQLLHRYKDDKKKQNIIIEVYSLFVNWLENQFKGLKPNSSISPTSFIDESKKKFGLEGLEISLEIMQMQINYQETSPWNQIRRVNWKNTIELKALFESESLQTYYGNFIDQRFIDYLNNNFDDIGRINWRKFEGLTCEYFKRQGYFVEIGRGRNDGGIDARIWKSKEDSENPPLILVQCKRQKEKIDRVIVKALYADVLHEKAESGLLVTCSEVSKGAKSDCNARGYNIRFSERRSMKEWISEMRTPYKGLTL